MAEDRLPTERLILLEGHPDVQKLIVTWPVVGVRVYPSEDERFDAWMRVSGVDISDISRLEPILFENGLLGPEGYVDSDVLLYIKATVVETLEASAKKRKARR